MYSRPVAIKDERKEESELDRANLYGAEGQRVMRPRRYPEWPEVIRAQLTPEGHGETDVSQALSGTEDRGSD
jgi:hypothetical protein